ncbi:sister chromatid cohesion 1 protein 1 isoform X1 [Amborella trichopoda]|uniref:sister chromatid cohesion 1 protein 1 isoform X1 n=1 Tax=Amborella trichopoda TaxID=13333 RepID=UPI0009BDBCBA|nr:sister chromatid cohesion 1 protein 1 isoform X1 [Amborella trichopoda]|eukprot:XP_020524675.1 sister chromatid cohesion 1 protein 1 isoform X1 [Amborella trichopoda]
MFYSHQLLSRKVPLGQIWMAATLHTKFNRKILYKIDIIQICEQILNPSVPLALRLSGILMGGVVIVYDRKVKLLLDDVTRFLVEINTSWKPEEVSDPTLLPPRKSHAKFESVTIKYGDGLVSDIEQIRFSHAHSKTAYTPFEDFMPLDQLEKINLADEDEHHHHQADASNITLLDDFTSFQATTDQFERFDMDEWGDGLYGTTHDQTMHDLHLGPDQTMHDLHHDPNPEEPQDEAHATPPQQQQQMEVETESAHGEQVVHGVEQRRPQKRKARDHSKIIIDKQIIISGQVYQSWLQDTSDILDRSSKKKATTPLASKPQPSQIISKTMDLPLVSLLTDPEDVPALLDLWKGCIPHPVKGRGAPWPQQSPHSPPPLSDNIYPDFQPNFGAYDFQNETVHSALERQRTVAGINQGTGPMRKELLGSGQTGTSISGSISGQGPQYEAEVLPTQASDISQSEQPNSLVGADLDVVHEETSYNTSTLKIAESPKNTSGRKHFTGAKNPVGMDGEFMVETAPTQQTPVQPNPTKSIDRVTSIIMRNLKEHFDKSNASATLTINELTNGMDRRRAAKLFYHTLVMASNNFIKVQQAECYGEIFISQGNM